MLLRHAKAEKAAPGVRDRDRRLNARGQGDPAMIAAYMVRHDLQPQRILVSSAQRTRETWGCMAEAFAALPVAYDDRLYESGPAAILANFDVRAATAELHNRLVLPPSRPPMIGIRAAL